MPPLISIIMPAYNASQLISQSIDSVLAQTYPHWELIIINDKSTDNTLQVIRTYTDPRIKIIDSPKNQGTAKARNTGIATATGHWLAFLDSDDLWTPEKLEQQLAFATQHNAAITYTSTAYINHLGQKSPYILPAKARLTYKQLLRRNLMSCSSIMLLRKIMIPFPTGHVHEDYVVWLTLLKSHPHAHGLNQPLLIYRMGQATKSSNRLNSMKMILQAYKAVGYSTLVAWLLTARYAVHSISKRRKIKF